MSTTPHEPLDPQLAAIVSRLDALGAPPLFQGDLAATRERMDRAAAENRKPELLPRIGTTEDIVISHHGLQVPARIYRPEVTDDTCPTVVFFHGGGFALGSVAMADDIAHKLCHDLASVIVSVDYRLAPEHPYPAAHDDALAATAWALAHARSLGGDAHRVAVAGESAGANLAASCALLLRSHLPRLIAQLLVVPGVDMARDTQALERDGRAHPLLGPADLRDIARLYMGDAAAASSSFPPSPLRADTLAGAPPAVVAVAGHDPLHDEGLRYVDRLRAEGVAVDLLRFPTLFHPFLGFWAAATAARQASDDIGITFRKRLTSA